MCNHPKTKVIDVRRKDAIRRRRQCKICNEKFTTYEVSDEEIAKIRHVLKSLNAIKIYVKKIPGIDLI